MSNSTIYCIPVGDEWALAYGVAIAWIVVACLGCCCTIMSRCFGPTNDSIERKLDTIIGFERYRHIHKV